MFGTLVAFALSAQPSAMVDVTDAVGLGPTVVPETVARICFADLNGDGWPDVVVDRHRVFLNRPDAASPIGRRFVEVASGLDKPQSGTATVFADLDNDGRLDAVVSENCQPDDPKWKDHGMRTRWQRGRGDGSFDKPQSLPTPPRPTIAIAVGDLNRDGRLDLFFANSYKSGDTYEGFPGDLLLSNSNGGWDHLSLPDEKIGFDEDTDPGGRPTYGAMILSLDGKQPSIFSLSYGRRWNRLWSQDAKGSWVDRAPQLGLDGDDNRNGAYPDWLVEYAKTHPQFPSTPEKPFRANGNNFDASIGDVDGDGRFDVFDSTIHHAWAGESSDSSRLLFQGPDGRFSPRPAYNVDRDQSGTKWNQGDLFAELADLDCDGALDLVLSSGDYPDNHLRIYLQRDGRFVESSDVLPFQHDGSQQISLADIDRNGRLDLAVGQTFFRLDAAQINGRVPHLKIFANRLAPANRSLTIRLKGDGKTVNRNALGAIVRLVAADGRNQMHQLVGIGGHGGKQHDFVVVFGLGAADRAKRVEVVWPNKELRTQTFKNVAAGEYRLSVGGKLRKV